MKKDTLWLAVIGLLGLSIVTKKQEELEGEMQSRLDDLENKLDSENEYGPDNPYNPYAVANGSKDPDDIWGPLE